MRIHFFVETRLTPPDRRLPPPCAPLSNALSILSLSLVFAVVLRRRRRRETTFRNERLNTFVIQCL